MLSDFHNAFCISNSVCCQLAETLEIQRLFFILAVGWILELIFPTVLLLNTTRGQKVKVLPGKRCLCLPTPVWLNLSSREDLSLLVWKVGEDLTSALRQGPLPSSCLFSCLSSGCFSFLVCSKNIFTDLEINWICEIWGLYFLKLCKEVPWEASKALI